MRLFGTDGIRGIAGAELDCSLAMRVGAALGVRLEAYGKNIILGRDTRRSSDMLAAAISAGLCSFGLDVIDVGVCPTPAVAYLVTKCGAAGGVMISASHNPYEYNGIKVFGADGMKLPDSEEDEIEAVVNSPLRKSLSCEKIGRIYPSFELIAQYEKHIKKAFGTSLSGMRIAIDCANGSTSVTANRIFAGLGAECIMLGNTPNGININSGCGSTDLTSIKWAVREGKCDAGVAFDGDGDRCIAVDGTGREIDGDYIMAILALGMKKRGILASNTLVCTVMSNMGLRKFCDEHRLGLLETRVGDRYVLEAMNKYGYSLGGEQSGHIIFRDAMTTGDGQLTALALLREIKESGKSLEALAACMRKYPQCTINIEADNDAKARLDEQTIKRITHFFENKLSDDGRILLRPSGTEPKIRIMVEAACDKVAEDCASKVADEIKRLIL